ncbi:hypothetical protein YC2023_067607 [Brassica napus]
MVFPSGFGVPDRLSFRRCIDSFDERSDLSLEAVATLAPTSPALDSGRQWLLSSPEELDSTVWGFPLEHRRGVFGCRVLYSVSFMGQTVVAFVEGYVRCSCGCGLAFGLGLGVLSLFFGVNSITGCVNKTGSRSFYRLRLGVMVRMRRAESLLKVQWRVEVGIEGRSQRRLRILTCLDSVYVLVMLSASSLVQFIMYLLLDPPQLCFHLSV